MARKGSRVLIGLVCEVCGSQNYTTQKNKVNTTDSIKLNKYCRACRKKSAHKEKKKLG